MMVINLFDYGDIHEVMWNCTLYIRMGGLAAPSKITTTIQETTSSNRMPQITMLITMPNTIANLL